MAWYNSSWDRRVKITVDATHVDSSQTNFPLLIDERSLPASFWTNVQSDGGDIVVTSSDGTTKLDRDLAEWDSSSNAITMRVRVPTLANSTNTVLYLYYDNSSANEANTTNTYRSAIKSYHPMGEDPSGNAPQIIDRTASNVDFTTAGTMTSGDLVAGQVSNCLDFDGSNDYLWVTDPSAWTFGNGSSDDAFSCSFWLRADTSTTGGVVGKVSGISTGEWYTLWASSKIFFRLIDQSASAYIGINPSGTLTNSNWHKVTVTYNGNGDETGMKVYYNGVSQGRTNSSTGTYTAMENTTSVGRVGSRSASADRFNGKLDEIMVFSEELSADYIKATFRNEDPGTYTFYTVDAEETNTGVVVLTTAADAIGNMVAPNVVHGSLTLTTTDASEIGNVVAPTTLYGSLTITGTASAIGNTLNPTTLAGSLTFTKTASAIGDTIDPTVLESSGNVVVSSALVNAISGTLDPTTLAGSLVFIRTVSAIGDTLITVLEGGDTVVTTTEASAIGGTIAPGVLYGSLTVSGTASSIGGTLSPTAVLGSLTLSGVASAVGDTVEPSILTEGSVIITGATVSAIGGTIAPTVVTVSLGREIDNVARWIFSSVAAHFEPIASGIDLLYHVEGIDERGDEVSRNDSVELRLTGPNIQEFNGKYVFRTEINLLLTNYMKMLEDTYSLVDWTGRFQAEMLERIPIYRLGTDYFDDGTYLACLVPTVKEGVKAYYLGQISNVDRIRQSELDGVYEMELSI